MNRISGIVSIHWRDRWSWIFIPLLVLLSSFTINLMISYFLEAEMYSGGVVSIFVYMLIYGSLSLHQTFPFALGMSVRRKDYLAGTLLYALLVSIVFAIFLYAMTIIENNLTNGWGSLLNFFHIPYWNDGNIIEQILACAIVMVQMYLIGFVFSSVHKRFGLRGLWILLITLVSAFTISAFVITSYQWWASIWMWISGNTAFELALWTIPLSIFYCIITYVLLMRTTV